MRNYGDRHQIGAGITATVILLLAILLLSVQIQNMTVTGSDRYFAKQVEELLLTGRWGKDSTRVYFSDKFHPHTQIPFTEDYKVVFRNPLNVEMIIYEKSIVEYVSCMNSFMYFDKDGIVVEGSGNQLPDVPWITGMEFSRIVLHHPLPADDRDIFKEILNLTQQLSVYDVAVDRIQYNSHGQAILFIGMMEIAMGDHAGINGKISTLSDILKAQPQFTETSGTMKLGNCSESSSGAGVTFKKK